MHQNFVYVYIYIYIYISVNSGEKKKKNIYEKINREPNYIQHKKKK